MATKKKTESKALVVSNVKDVSATGAVDVQVLIAQAMAKHLPLEQLTAALDRLQEMRREIKEERARELYFADLSAFQSECPIIEKGHKVHDRDKQTKAPKGVRYSYAAQEDLVEGIRPLLGAYGFSFHFTNEQSKDTVKAICHIHHRAGHEEVTDFTAPIDHDAYMTEPQKVAAATTFAQRYALKAAFGLQTRGEDRDESLPGFDQERKEPIKKSTETGEPVQNQASDYDMILRCLEATELDAKTKTAVKLFSEKERDAYHADASLAKDNPAQLKTILKDIVETGKKRRAAVKGE